MNKVRSRGELGFAGLLLALGIFILVDTTTIPVPKASSGVGPRFMPFAVGALLSLAAVFVVINILRGGHASPEESELVDPSLPVNWRRTAGMIGSVIAFALLLDPLGYVIAAAVTFFAIATTLGSRHYARTAVGALLLSVAIYLAFTRGLGIFLPPGLLEGIL